MADKKYYWNAQKNLRKIHFWGFFFVLLLSISLVSKESRSFIIIFLYMPKNSKVEVSNSYKGNKSSSQSNCPIPVVKNVIWVSTKFRCFQFYSVGYKFSYTWNELFVVNWFISFFLRKYQMKKSTIPTLSENFNEMKQTWHQLQPQTWSKVNL